MQSFIKLLTSTLITLLFCYGYSYAANYYVSSKNGLDLYNGRSAAKPKKTIQDAVNLTKPGDTVFVMNGVYTNECAACSVVNIIKSGNKKKYIVIRNYLGHRPQIIFNGWAGIAIRNRVSYVTVSGFEIIGNNANVTLKKALSQPGSCANPKGNYDPRYNGNGISIDGTNGKYPHHIIISNNVVRDCGGGGIGASHADYITVEENLVYNTSWYTVFGTSGIAFYQFWNSDNLGGYHNFIRRNKCFNNFSYVPWLKTCTFNDGNGIIVDDFRQRQNGSKLGEYRGRTLIENNICWYNGGTGIHTFQSDHVDIINNTAYCNSQTQGLKAGQILSGLGTDIRIINNIMVADAMVPVNSNYLNGSIIYENNLHYNITNPNNAIINITSSTCINQNPTFVSPLKSLNANFKLKPGSPAIGHGNKSFFSKYDFDGRTRPVTDTPDIGAYSSQ